jgi:subtilisin family serine protease
MDKTLAALCRSSYLALAIALAAPAVAAAAPDPLLAQQWALARPAAIGAPEAISQSTGAGVVVAVLDSGIQADHPDLAGNVWVNPGEVAGNGRDDDGDGIVDDIHGANMLEHDGDVDDDNGHGTFVAGIIAARRNNSVGGSGLAPDATIMAVKVLDSAMAGNTDALAAGIRYAVDRGARILNVSLNTDVATDSVAAAVRYAGEHGAVVVASAGNNGRSLDLVPSYPAALSDPAVLSVGASGEDGLLWQQSNTGSLAVDLAAPGVGITSTGNDSGYHSRTGTSAAAPFVSAALALLSAARPDLTMSALRETIIDSTQRSHVLAGLLSGGRLDVGAAMHRVLPGIRWKSAPASPPAAASLRLRTRPSVLAAAREKLGWSAAGAHGITRWRVSLDGRVVVSLPARRRATSRRIARAGRHMWRVVGVDAGGERVVVARLAFRSAGRANT